jgi:hypothetical protein
MKLHPFVAALSLAAGAALPARAGDEPKGKVPALDLRAVPRISFSPSNILLVAELQGGGDLEEFYCLELEWDFDDGTKSTREADCAPFAEGTPIERRFSVEHVFKRAGNYNVTVTMRRGSRTVKKGSVRVTVRPGVSDPTNVPDAG